MYLTSHSTTREVAIMKKTLLFVRLGCFVTICVIALLFNGCQKDNPVSDESGIPESNLFPLTSGRIWVFTAYELDTTTSQKIPSSVHREASYNQGSTTFNGKSAYRMIDSIYAPTGVLAWIETSYIALENGDLIQWDDGQRMWFSIFKKSAGLNTEYVIAQFQEVRDGFPVSVTFKGKIYPKEAVNAPIGTVQAYKLEMKAVATVGGTQVSAFENYIYFADGYGPVRMYTPVQRDPGSGLKVIGEESLLVSKNF